MPTREIMDRMPHTERTRERRRIRVGMALTKKICRGGGEGHRSQGQADETWSKTQLVLGKGGPEVLEPCLRGHRAAQAHAHNPELLVVSQCVYRAGRFGSGTGGVFLGDPLPAYEHPYHGKAKGDHRPDEERLPPSPGEFLELRRYQEGNPHDQVDSCKRKAVGKGDAVTGDPLLDDEGSGRLSRGEEKARAHSPYEEGSKDRRPAL